MTTSWASIASSSLETPQSQKKTNDSLQDKRIAVVDASALIKGHPLHNVYDIIYTVKDVYDEVRDKSARNRLQNFPFKVETLEPNADAVKAVVSFARGTGDLDFLSTADIKLTALAFQFEKEIYGTDHLQFIPKKAVAVKTKPAGKQTDLPGWGHVPNPEDWDVLDQLTEAKAKEMRTWQQAGTSQSAQSAKNDIALSSPDENIESLSQGTEYQSHEAVSWTEVSKSSKQPKRKINKIKSVNITEAEVPGTHNSRVCCLTSDFGIQNILLQMGLKLVTPDGVRIRHLTQWGLKCASCFHTTKKSGKIFCPNCGNSTLFKVRIEIDENGAEVYGGLSKPQQRRGAKCSIPPPKGGKNNKDAILSEDMMHQALQRFRNVKVTNGPDIISPEYDEDSWFKTRVIKNEIKDQLPGRFGYPKFIAKHGPHRRKH